MRFKLSRLSILICIIGSILCSEFEENLTWYKWLLMISSHLIMAPGIYIFYYIGKDDFALSGLLSNIMSLYYHVIQMGLVGRWMMVIAHIGDFTFIAVLMITIFMSWFKVNQERRVAIIKIFYIFPFFLGTITYSSYAMIFILLASVAVILYFQHRYNMENYNNKWRFDKFNILCLFGIVTFAIAGTFFIYWGGNPGEEHYWWRHDTWHFFIFGAFSIAALIYLKLYIEQIGTIYGEKKKVYLAKDVVHEKKKPSKKASKKSSKKEKNQSRLSMYGEVLKERSKSASSSSSSSSSNYESSNDESSDEGPDHSWEHDDYI